MIFFKNILTILFLSFILVGCSSTKQNMEVCGNVFNKPSSLVIAQIDGLENAQFHIEGGQGLIDIIINEAVTDKLVQALKKIDTKLIIEEHYYKSFEKKFLDRSFRVIKINDKIQKKSLIEYADNSNENAHFDFRWMKDKYNADYALILEPQKFGIVRTYFGFIPTSVPTGCARLSVYLISLKDNKILGHYNADENMIVRDEWDTPPDYIRLQKACKSVLVNALHSSYINLFND